MVKTEFDKRKILFWNHGQKKGRQVQRGIYSGTDINDGRFAKTTRILLNH